MSAPAEVICGHRLYGCWCGLTPGHGDLHECAEPDPQCGGAWRDHENPELVYIVRWPGTRGGPNTGGPPDPGPESTVIEPRHAPPFQVARGPIRFLPPGFDQ